MPFRNLAAAPEDLAKLSAAFDTAWADISGVASIDTDDQVRAKERLGYILIALWRDDPSSNLADLAVARYLRDTLDAKPKQPAG